MISSYLLTTTISSAVSPLFPFSLSPPYNSFLEYKLQKTLIKKKLQKTKFSTINLNALQLFDMAT